ANQIDVVDWTWGMTAPSAVGGTRTGRTLLGELKLVKRTDKASTALMSVMRNNEILSSAVLSVRKAGGTALPYFVMKLNDARVNAFTVQSEISADGAPVLTEHLSLTYKSISIEYTVQTSKGGSQSTSSFVAETAPE
ncbi:MAG: type VI secretion system tube protein Hcp, partial [Burkholderiaceae bacterium]|nr:type VI secretion system tube protein Hcp [Burkholderiaceae bacterium]